MADRCVDDQAGVAINSCSDHPPKKITRPETTQTATISFAMQQQKVNQSAKLMLARCKKKINVTAIVHCHIKTTCGETYVLWARYHQRYRGADGPERIRAVEAMDDLHQDQEEFLLMWPEVMSRVPNIQRKAMELNSYTVKQVSKAESKRARAENRAPLFASDACEAENTQRSTTDNLYLCEDADDDTGIVVKLKACMDNGLIGSMCINTASVAGALPSHSVLRAFYASDDLVEMPAEIKK